MTGTSFHLAVALRDGMEYDTGETLVRYRWLRPDDDLDAITDLLHRAYRPLLDAGMRFVASHQDVQTTRNRMAKGETIVAVEGDLVIGVITLMDAGSSGGTPHYAQAGVAKCWQFAVEPKHQGRGIGSRLMTLVEERAQEKGASELALDTSEHAAHLIRFYEKRGYRFIEFVQWSVVNYRSIVLSKRLR